MGSHTDAPITNTFSTRVSRSRRARRVAKEQSCITTLNFDTRAASRPPISAVVIMAEIAGAEGGMIPAGEAGRDYPAAQLGSPRLLTRHHRNAHRVHRSAIA